MNTWTHEHSFQGKKQLKIRPQCKKFWLWGDFGQCFDIVPRLLNLLAGNGVPIEDFKKQAKHHSTNIQLRHNILVCDLRLWRIAQPCGLRECWLPGIELTTCQCIVAKIRENKLSWIGNWISKWSEASSDFASFTCSKSPARTAWSLILGSWNSSFVPPVYRRWEILKIKIWITMIH